MNKAFNEYISIFKVFVQNDKNIYYDLIQIFKEDVNKSSSIISFNRIIFKININNVNLLVEKILRLLRELLDDKEIIEISNQFLEIRSKKIEEKIRNLQFVEDCSNVKKLVCEVYQNCGYLCQLHFLIVCYIQAYYQNRTVIFKDLDPSNVLDQPKFSGHIKVGQYLNRFTESFLPFSNCVYNPNDSIIVIQTGK